MLQARSMSRSSVLGQIRRRFWGSAAKKFYKHFGFIPLPDRTTRVDVAFISPSTTQSDNAVADFAASTNFSGAAQAPFHNSVKLGIGAYLSGLLMQSAMSGKLTQCIRKKSIASYGLSPFNLGDGVGHGRRLPAFNRNEKCRLIAAANSRLVLHRSRPAVPPRCGPEPERPPIGCLWDPSP